ncbi:MAG: tetratricopeptide repeat protein [Gammaproteobacteria bacterium]
MKRLRILLLAAALASPVAGAVTADQENELYLQAVRLMAEGRHDEARAALEKLIALEPQHAGAYLDLAISQCELGHAVEAERLFREIEVRFAPSAGILEVINNRRRQGCRPWQPKVNAFVTLTRGHDTNVNQGASNPVFATGSGPDRIEHLLTADYLPHSDNFTQAAFDYSRELNSWGSVALAQVRSRHHDSLTSQDTNAVVVGLDQPVKVGGMATRALATVGVISLDGKLYQRQAQLQGRITPKVPLPDNYELVLAASVGHISYLRRSAFNANTGEASALLNYGTRDSRVQVALGGLLDHGTGQRPGGDRKGWYNSVLWQRGFGGRYIGELGWTRQDWHGEDLYSPGLINEVRHQSTRLLRAGLAVNITQQQSLQLEWRHVHNKENISLFQYNSQSVQLNWRWNGF